MGLPSICCWLHPCLPRSLWWHPLRWPTNEVTWLPGCWASNGCCYLTKHRPWASLRRPMRSCWSATKRCSRLAMLWSDLVTVSDINQWSQDHYNKHWLGESTFVGMLISRSKCYGSKNCEPKENYTVNVTRCLPETSLTIRLISRIKQGNCKKISAPVYR